MKKIIVFYATAGIGHMKAAMALGDTLKEKDRIDFSVLDALDYTNAFFKTVYNRIYLFLIKYIPTIWGLCYYILDNPYVYCGVKLMRHITNRINSRKLAEYMLKINPDTIIVTHFFPLEVAVYLKRKGLLHSKLIVVITDYRAHTFWISDYVDIYIAGSEYTKSDLLKRNISPDKVRVYGIPCSRLFSKKIDKKMARKRLGLEEGLHTIFVLGGGFGVGPIRRIFRYLDKMYMRFQCIIVCGHNRKLKEELEPLSKKASHIFKIYGFVDNVHEMMFASNVLISKSGGMTITEAVAAGIPMIVVNPVPGQEMRNYTFLKVHNAGLRLSRVSKLPQIISELFSGGSLARIRENIEKIRVENSAYRIINEAVG